MHFVNISFLNCGPDILRWDRGDCIQPNARPCIYQTAEIFLLLRYERWWRAKNYELGLEDCHLSFSVTVKGTVRPDWICMSVEPLDRP